MLSINLKKEKTFSAIEERNINVEKTDFLTESLRHIFSLNSLDLCEAQNITNLTLSNSNISFLPIELGLLPFLQRVNLSHNDLAQSKWTWLEQATIQKNLIELDISDNSLTELPPQIGKLNTLTCLKACFNKLRRLPQSIGMLQNLRHIDLSHNKLEILPASLKFLGLMYLDISENLLKRKFFFQIDLDLEIGFALKIIQKVPTLKELSAKIILGSREPYDRNLMPSTLVKYLDEANYCCMCKKACIDVYKQCDICTTYLLLTNIIKDIQGLSESDYIVLECCFCSQSCLGFFYNGYFRNVNDDED